MGYLKDTGAPFPFSSLLCPWKKWNVPDGHRAYFPVFPKEEGQHLTMHTRTGWKKGLMAQKSSLLPRALGPHPQERVSGGPLLDWHEFTLITSLCPLHLFVKNSPEM